MTHFLLWDPHLCLSHRYTSSAVPFSLNMNPTWRTEIGGLPLHLLLLFTSHKTARTHFSALSPRALCLTPFLFLWLSVNYKTGLGWCTHDAPGTSGSETDADVPSCIFSWLKVHFVVRQQPNMSWHILYLICPAGMRSWWRHTDTTGTK